ncbi:MAG: hypothetical protein O3A14_16820 [Cyanobacteria bacterium]|nr:hypothetical protein [Cyanobacteriota bacterium]
MQKFLLTLAATALLSPLAISPAQAQRVINVNPEVNGQQVAPGTSISGEFDTSAGTVQPGSVVILVNGVDVTADSTITSRFFSYRPTTAFSPGDIPVQVEYVGNDGFRRVAAWQFTVQAPRPQVEISGVTHNATTKPLGSGSSLLVTINGTPGAEAVVFLVKDGQTVQSLTADEVSAGVYVATLPVANNAQLNEGIVVARLSIQGETTYDVAAQSVAFTTATAVTTAPVTTVEDPNAVQQAVVPPLSPVFTSHQDGGRVNGNSFTLVGQTRPGATVAVRVVGSTSVFGLASVQQDLLSSQVTADSTGLFQVNVPLGLQTGGGTRYDVTATAREGGEQATTTLTLTHQ